MQNISIDLMTEDSLKDAPISELEALQTELYNVGVTLKAKQAMVAKVTEAKQNAANAAKKAGQLTDDEKRALQDHFAAEDKIKNSAMSDEDKAAALAALNNPNEKPPAQNLIGDHITRDNDQVNPGV